MNDQEPMLSRQETAARNLVSYIESDINKEGNKQLMLFLGICLNDVDIVNKKLKINDPQDVPNREFHGPF